MGVEKDMIGAGVGCMGSHAGVASLLVAAAGKVKGEGSSSVASGLQTKWACGLTLC